MWKIMGTFNRIFNWDKLPIRDEYYEMLNVKSTPLLEPSDGFNRSTFLDRLNCWNIIQRNLAAFNNATIKESFNVLTTKHPNP